MSPNLPLLFFSISLLSSFYEASLASTSDTYLPIPVGAFPDMTRINAAIANSKRCSYAMKGLAKLINKLPKEYDKDHPYALIDCVFELKDSIQDMEDMANSLKAYKRDGKEIHMRNAILSLVGGASVLTMECKQELTDASIQLRNNAPLRKMQDLEKLINDTMCLVGLQVCE